MFEAWDSERLKLGTQKFLVGVLQTTRTRGDDGYETKG
jgi:hypothetical protein